MTVWVNERFNTLNVPASDDNLELAELERAALQEDVHTEIGVIRAELRVKQDQLFAEFDRFQSEAELRLAIVPPLTMLILVFAIKGSWIWALGLIATLVLLRQATNASRASLDVLATALRLGIVKSPSMEEMTAWARSRSPSTPPGPAIETDRARQETRDRESPAQPVE
jgi:hypothetical protein